MTERASEPETAHPGAVRAWIAAHRLALRQTARVVVGAVVTYIAYKALGLQQGYWAVLTVIIVLQASIGGTLGAAGDRLAGTIAGAIVGGIAAVVAPHTGVGIGVAVAVAVGIGALAAAIRPQLRIAPVTAAIVLLSPRTGGSVHDYVLDRVVEIAMGGVIGVTISLLVLPARSHGIVLEKAADAIDREAALIGDIVDGLRQSGSAPAAHDHAALRRALTAVETAMGDAEREKQSRLADHGIPEALPRTLWRVRNDIVLIGRGLEGALPDTDAMPLARIFSDALEPAAMFLARCRGALIAATRVDRGDLEDRHGDFARAIEALRAADATRTLDFDAVGRTYGVIFAIEQLYRNLADLADRIDEAGAAPVRTSLFARLTRRWRRDRPDT